MVTTLPGIDQMKPGFAGKPFPGIEARVVDENGKEVSSGGGYIAITKPWPAMLRTIWGDPERYVSTYWAKWPDIYFPADGAKYDKDGYILFLGRVDDVLNVAGHRIGTMEVESALVDHPSVAEAAVVGVSHPLKGQAIAAFVTIKEGKVAGSRPGGRAEGARGHEDRRHRPAGDHHLQQRAAQDPQRQDHAG